MAIGNSQPSTSQVPDTSVQDVPNAPAQDVPNTPDWIGQIEVVIKEKDSEEVQRQIREKNNWVLELMEICPSIKYEDLEPIKTPSFKTLNILRFKYEEKMGYNFRFSFAYYKSSNDGANKLSEISKHWTTLKKIFEKDGYKVKFYSPKDNPFLQVTDSENNSNEIGSEDDDCLLGNESGNVVDNSIKGNWNWFNFSCCATAHKDETGCFTGLFDLLKKGCCCCSNKN